MGGISVLEGERSCFVMMIFCRFNEFEKSLGTFFLMKVIDRNKFLVAIVKFGSRIKNYYHRIIIIYKQFHKKVES